MPQIEGHETSYFMTLHKEGSNKPIFTITHDLKLVLGEGVTPQDVADELVKAWSDAMETWLKRHGR